MIYRIHQDRKYKTFSVNNDDIWEKLGEDTMFHIDRTPCSYIKNWQPIKIDFYSDNRKALVPDITESNGKLFFSKKAAEVLTPILEDDGEFLPVYSSEATGFLYNCLSTSEQVDGLDAEKSIDDPYSGNSFISFHESKVRGLKVFKTEFDTYLGIFCTEGVKTAVENSDLKGIVFSEDLGNMFPPDVDSSQPLNN